MRTRLLLAGILLTTVTFAQDLGGLPQIEWRILEGDSVDVVTAPSTRAFAERALALDEALIRLRPLPLGGKIKSIDLVIQPVTVVPNGFVGVTPWRSYLYATPPQDQGLVSSNAWADALAIHEYRHVEQYANLLRGWTKVARVLFGNGGWGVATGLSTPNWFFEGDAVYSETVLTYAGRGRTPGFSALQRAMALDSLRYRYIKARNGSLENRVPNHYPLGYAMVEHGRLVHGDPWPEVVRKAGNFWPPLYPFSLALKHETGFSTRGFYRETYDSLATVWRERAASTPMTPQRRITPLGRQIPIYRLPQPVGEVGSGELIALRSSRVNIEQLVRIRADGSEEKLTPLGINVDDAFHVAGGRVAWTRVRFAERRTNQTFADLVVLDLDGGGAPRRITTDEQLFSPGLSPDGAYVTAVRIGRSEGQTCLVEFDVATGVQTREVCFDLDLIVSPRYGSSDKQEVVVVAKRDGFLALYALGFDGQTRALTDWTRHTLSTPYVHNGRVYFTASFTGIDNAFSVSLDGSKVVTQLTSVPVGAYTPSTDGERLYFTEVTPDGDPVSVLDKGDWLNQEIAIVEPAALPQYAALVPDAAGEGFRQNFLPQRPPAGVGAVEPGLPTAAAADFGKPYRSVLRGLRVNSLQPIVNNVEASYTLDAETILSDVAAQLSAGYNLNEKRGFVNGSLTVAKTWPWVSVDFGQQSRNFVTVDLDSLAARRLRLREQDFRERFVGVTLSAPLRQQVGAYSYSLQPDIGVDVYGFRELDSETRRSLTDDQLVSANADLDARRLRQVATKHILPREGQTISLRYRNGVNGPTSSQLNIAVAQYLPGFARSHGIVARLRYREESTLNQYQFQDRFFYARGYDKIISDKTVTASVDYHLPLWYPDFGFGGLVYVPRVRANAWGDYMQFRYDDPYAVKSNAVASVGVDVTVDAVFFNAQPLPVGIRFAYRLKEDFLGVNEVGFAPVRLLLALPL